MIQSQNVHILSFYRFLYLYLKIVNLLLLDLLHDFILHVYLIF